jgi:glycosyltransferase involved in cell wall biosynthesis
MTSAPVNQLSAIPPPPEGKTGWPWTMSSYIPPVNPQKKFPKISVVTSSYNQGNFIEETIRSIILQNYPNLEYIIIDGGSNDNTIEILKKYEPWITYWVSEKDSGCADALNRGISKSTGDFFYYLNSDDFLHPNTFHKAASFILENPNFDVYYGHGNSLDQIANKNFNIYSSQWSLTKYLSGRATLVQQATFINLNFLNKNNINFNTANRTCWDGELLVDLSLKDAKYIRMPFSFILAAFRIHQNSITGAQTVADKYQIEIARIREKITTQKPNLKSVNSNNSALADLISDFKLIFYRGISRFSQ